MSTENEIVSQVTIPVGTVALEGELVLPADAHGLIVFVHGSGSSRFSPRNRAVAETLREYGLGTLLFDLLTKEEESVDISTRKLRFDIKMLAGRLVTVVNWLQKQDLTRELPVGLFGASTGGGAALVAAAELPDAIKAVVSRGGRPDLAGDPLRNVNVPTLLIVGELDDIVIELNRQAIAQMRCETELKIVPEATHLFEEPGALDLVAQLAGHWFADWLHREIKAKSA